METVGLKKAGPLRNGWERGKGSIVHAVETNGRPIDYVAADGTPALCGARPAIMWTGDGSDQITCPRCKRVED